MARRSPLLVAIAVLSLWPCLLGQGNSRQEAVQQALNKQATIATERQGALVLRDLRKRCGVSEPAITQLREALDQVIAAWVKAHPPQVYGSYEPDLRGILQQPAWTKALQANLGPEALAAWQALEADRRQRLLAATGRFMRELVACELRLTPSQITAIEPSCQRLAEQSMDAPLRTRPSQLVRDMDRGINKVLSEVQSEYPQLLSARGSRRDAGTEFVLESERIRLLCGLDESRASLLRACGASQARKQATAVQARAKAEAEAKKAAEEAAKAAAKNAPAAAAAAAPPAAAPAAAATRPAPPVYNGLPSDECFADAFWTKVRDSVLTAAEKQLLATSPVVDTRAVGKARVALTLASLESIFRLDPEQVQALLPLAEKVVEQDLKSTRVMMLDVTRGFGMQIGRQDAAPEERAIMRAFEDLLDRPQFEVLRDKVGI